jgi:thioredoxin reductase
MHVLVVGGGDSALEAAISIAQEPGTHVTLSYRGDSFNRAKDKNRQKIKKAEEAGNLKVLLNSNVKAIKEQTVEIDQDGKVAEIPNGGVIISAGGILPTEFLKKVGIEVETKYGTA